MNSTEAQAAADLGENVSTGDHIAAEHNYGGQYATRVTLKKPITRASAEMEPVAVLYLKEPTAGDLRGIKLANLMQFDGGELAELLTRIAMPRLSPQEAKSLSFADTVAVGGALAVFLQ